MYIHTRFNLNQIIKFIGFEINPISKSTRFILNQIKIISRFKTNQINEKLYGLLNYLGVPAYRGNRVDLNVSKYHGNCEDLGVLACSDHTR